MSAPDPPLNPYAPTLESEDPASLAAGLPEEEPPVIKSWPKIAIRWLTVCGLSAVPSFLFGMGVSGGQIAAMLLGIVIFAAGYTIVDHHTADWRFRRNRAIRRTLYITYGTRIVISVLVPVGAYVDIFCGMLSLRVTESFTGQGLTSFDSGEPMTFLATLLTTLVQGVLLNLVLSVYAVVIYGILLTVSVLRR